jgi:hypothetical protein
VARGRWFCTRYPSGDATFGTTLFATDVAEARRLCKKRGLDESLEKEGGWSKRADFVRPSRLLWANSAIGPLLHAMTFLFHIAVRSGVVPAWNVLSDTGLFHEVQHYCLFGKDKPIRVNGRPYSNTIPKRVLYDRLKALEESVPGYTETRVRRRR